MGSRLATDGVGTVPPLTVVGAVIVRSDVVLVARRSPSRSLGGLWEFPGGKVETGEAPPDALAREVLEELGVRVRVGDLVARRVTPMGDRDIDLACYWASLEGRLPTRSTDHDALTWVEPAALPDLEWSPADIPIVAEVVRVLRGETPTG